MFHRARSSPPRLTPRPALREKLTMPRRRHFRTLGLPEAGQEKQVPDFPMVMPTSLYDPSV